MGLPDFGVPIDGPSTSEDNGNSFIGWQDWTVRAYDYDSKFPPLYNVH